MHLNVRCVLDPEIMRRRQRAQDNKSLVAWLPQNLWDTFAPVSYTHLTLPTTPYV